MAFVKHHWIPVANSNNHFFATELLTHTSGVEAFDFLCEKMSPRMVDPTMFNADLFSRFNLLRLSSVQPGAYAKFIANFQEALDDLMSTGAFLPTDDFKKSTLIAKLPDQEYGQMKLPHTTGGTFDQFLVDLNAFAVGQDERINNKDTRNSNIHNTNSDEPGSSSGKRKIDSINSTPLKSEGFASGEDYHNLSQEKKEAFNKKKRIELEDNPNVEFKQHSKFKSGGSSIFKGNGSGKSSNANKTFERKIQALKKEWKESKSKEKGGKSSPSDKKSSISTINMLFPKMAEESKQR